MRIAVAIAALVVLLSPTTGFAASFDCDRASTEDEYAICQNRDLNDLDVKMVTIFDIVKSLVMMGQRGALEDDQREWLSDRRRCDDDVRCLRRSYRKRIAELEDVLQEIRSRGSF